MTRQMFYVFAVEHIALLLLHMKHMWKTQPAHHCIILLPARTSRPP